MSVQGWMMQGASTTSCDLVFRIGSEVGGSALSKTTDVDVTLVMDDGALAVSDSGTINYSDLDNDGSRDCFGRFHVSGGSEGNTYAGTLTSESDGIAVRVQVKTIPNGRIKKADISCDGTWNSQAVGLPADIQGGANTWLPIAQKIVAEDVHYVNLIDDAYYLWASWDAGEVDFAPPANTSSFTSPNILSVDSYTDNITNASSAGSASDENAAIYRHIRTAFLHPAFQLVGQHCPINFTMGDHEFVGNDFKWEPTVPQGLDFDTTQKCADAGELCMSVWQNAFYPSNPSKYTTAATTAEYPKRITRNETDTADVNPVTEYGVTASNFYPHSQVIKNDIMADYLPDVMRHRGRADADDSMLGSQGYTDLVAALASHDSGGSEPLPYVHVSIAKQFYRMIRETPDSMVDDSPTEAGNLQTALKARDKAIVSTSGDIHGAQQLIDGNVLASCVSAVSSNVTLITDLVAVWDKTGDFATDPGENVSNIHAGTKDTSKAALGNHSRYSYGITEYAPHKATHRLMDWRGNVIGGVVELKPYNTAIFYESNPIYSEAVNTMSQIDVLFYPGSDLSASPNFGMGTSASHAVTVTNVTKAAGGVVTQSGHGLTVGDAIFWGSVTSGMTELDGQVSRVTGVTDANTYTINTNTSAYTAWSGISSIRKLMSNGPLEILCGEADGDGKYAAAIAAVSDLNIGKVVGLSVTLDWDRTQGTQSGTASDFSDWPTGLVVTVSDEDGSNPKVVDANTIEDSGTGQSIISGGTSKIYADESETSVFSDLNVPYRINVQWPSVGGAGTGESATISHSIIKHV